MAHTQADLAEAYEAGLSEVSAAYDPPEPRRHSRGIESRPVADCLEEAGDRLFTFTRLPRSQWRSARTTNAIERLHEEFKRRIKNADRIAIGRYCGDVVLGAARLWSDQHA